MPTKIEWTHLPGTIGESWNVITGCSKISEGCKNCYAERMARRLAGRCGYPEYPHHFDVTLRPDRLEQPLKWKKPRTVFVVSMGDLYHEKVPASFITNVYEIMDIARQHTFIVLTKRPERIMPVLYGEEGDWYLGGGDYIPNIWHLATTENQPMADKRIPELLRLKEHGWPVLGLSCEPLLSPIDLLPYLANNSLYKAERYAGELHYRGEQQKDGSVIAVCDNGKAFYDGIDLDWVIVGAESGPGARPMDETWVRKIKNQCVTANVPFFYKQKVVKGKKVSLPELDGATWNQYPIDSRD